MVQGTVTIGSMTAKKQPPADRHKPSRMLRVPEKLAAILDQIAEQNFTTFTAEGVRAIRELCEREGWLSRKGKPADD